MERRLLATALLVATGGLVSVAVATTSQAMSRAPEKTAPPPAPATTAATTVPPSVTVWPSTTTDSATTTLPGPASTSANTSTSTGFPPPTTAFPGVPNFDAATFLSDFYAGLAVDPFVTSELADQNAVVGSPAFAFLYHEVGVAGSIDVFTDLQLPEYTVTANGPAVNVCRDDGRCESFSDFVLARGLLESFSVDGQPIAGWTSEYARRTTVESLTIDGTFAVRRPSDGLLSVVVLLTATGGGTAFGWEQATYVDATGRQFPIDPANSQFPEYVDDGGIDLAHVSFAGAQHGGQLIVPFTASDTGVATTIRIPIILQ